MRTRKLSCFVIACNEADRIEQCLAPLSGWVDQLLVLDSGSTDNTVELARKYTQEVHSTDWPGYGPQRNRALLLCDNEWVLNIDADEVITEALKSEIDLVLSEPNLDATLINIPWHTYLFGELLKHGRYSSPQGKLFFKVGAKFKDRQVHETLLLPNKKQRTLKSALIHHSWRNYRHIQEKHLKYACLLAEEKAAKGKTSRLSYAVLRFFTDFFQQYVLSLGFLDGWRGFLMAIILGQYAFHKYASLAELSLAKQKLKDESC
ncbi:glycosyltransferase family 2 protein [Shewanella baltica]|uniref:glycosyltransferase family 2 protein n=1 Tax=Shewanella baltica TaxID=62322 RepID=UPI00217E5873|nr:glycosyltransferase family 2 protein [Shewanella baltica]MCS6125494.1 glycosyltransferase family 2 protein [Shewanella baltica]MCS6178577.1 glycosyltransferase family 2 protein [Shewanella baltica]MCS6254723.1 glycosyltransferase family 2 protein [Shewanella baltica]